MNLSKSKPKAQGFPSKTGVAEFVNETGSWLFPVIEGGDACRYSKRHLQTRLLNLLHPLSARLSQEPEEIADAFFNSLPNVKEKLGKDADFIAANDPAAYDVNEVILAYPGFFAILAFRLSHELYDLKVPLLPRMMTEYAHSHTGIDIHPGARISSPFFIDHGTGIVIGETSDIGPQVKIYQGVTIGALSVTKALQSVKRHPTIEENVVIYAGSTILGGETIIGHDSVIGGNVWLTESVPPFSMVYHKSEVKIRSRNQAQASEDLWWGMGI